MFYKLKHISINLILLEINFLFTVKINKLEFMGYI